MRVVDGITAFKNTENVREPIVTIVRKDQSQGHVYNELDCQVESRAYQMYVGSGNWIVKNASN